MNTVTPPSGERRGHVRSVVEVRSTSTDPEWDEFVAKSPGGDIVQTSGWARLKQSLGLRPLRVLVREDGAIAAGAQMLVKPLGMVGPVAYSPRAPLLRADAEAAHAEHLVAAMVATVRQRRIRHLVLQPPATSGGWPDAIQVTHGFLPTPLELAPTATVCVDLAEEEDAQFASFRRSVRRNIRRTLRAGARLREGDRGDLELFRRLHTVSAKRNGFRPASQEYLEQAWDLLHPDLRLFFLDQDGESLCGLWVSCFGGTVTERLAGWSGASSLRPNETARWEMMRWARVRGFERYDLGGVTRPAAHAHLAGNIEEARSLDPASGFKLGFGAPPSLLPQAWELIPNPARRLLYRRLYPAIAGSTLVGQLKRRVLQSG